MKKTILLTIIALFASASVYAQTAIVTMTTAKSVGETLNITTSWTGAGSVTANGVTMNNSTSSSTSVPVPVGGKIELIATGNVSLTTLVCNYNQLTTLDVSSNTALTALYCFNNQLTMLDVSNNTKLEWLDCYGNLLTALDVSNNTKLEWLLCSNNRLTALDVSNNTKLEWLHCHTNLLTALDVSNNMKLEWLFCSNNRLTALDMSNNTALTALYCFNNQLTALDVSNNTALTELYCYDNHLSALNVSSCPALIALGCSNNQLTTLDVSNNTELTSLHCSSNRLATLDVSNNIELTSLSCSNNQLTSLNLSGCNTLEYVLAGGQRITISLAADAASFLNPIYYHNQTAIENVRINGMPYAQGEAVAIPAGITELTFTSTAIGSDYYGDESPFCGTITFVPNTAVDNVNTAAVKVYSTASGIEVHNAPISASVEVYTLNGILITRTTETVIPLSHTGVYIVKVGDYVTKVVN